VMHDAADRAAGDVIVRTCKSEGVLTASAHVRDCFDPTRSPCLVRRVVATRQHGRRDNG